MRIQCDKCNHKVNDADTATSINMMKVHYATHTGTKPKGTKKKIN